MDSKGNADLVSAPELRCDLQRLNRMLQAAHRSSIDVRNSYDFYVLAYKEYNKGNVPDTYLYCDRAKYELTNAVNEAKMNFKGWRVHSLRTISFFFRLYGLYAIIFGVISALAFGELTYWYSDTQILGVPLWAPFFAGLGSSAQILTGVIDDLRKEGLVVRYKRFWYMAVPLLSTIFGYVVYLLFIGWFSAFSVGSPQGSTFTTMFVCFLTGFLTNWLINKLSNLSRDL